MGLSTLLAQKAAIGPCEANVGLSRNLAVVLLWNGWAHACHAVYHAVQRS